MEPLTPYELERLARIKSNQQRLAELGVQEAKQAVLDLNHTPVHRRTSGKQKAKMEPKQDIQPVRASRRLQGSAPECKSSAFDEDDTLEDLLERGGGKRKIVHSGDSCNQHVMQARCNSLGRGYIYDSVAGITCHFCRQKKLCGEPDCPRCETRDVQQSCIGKSACSRCQSALGRFCRACLLIRYGLELEDVRKMMEDGSWLCPHCYEEEHPDEGWICNSSICMKNRGLRPTGIAIYEAQERGFKSVAHYLQAQILKKTAPNMDSPASPATPSLASPAVIAPATPSNDAGPSTAQPCCPLPPTIPPTTRKNPKPQCSPFARQGDLPRRLTRSAVAQSAAIPSDQPNTPPEDSISPLDVTGHGTGTGGILASPGTPNLLLSSSRQGLRRHSRRDSQDSPQISQENQASPGSEGGLPPSSSMWFDNREVLGECRSQQHNIEGAAEGSQLLTCSSQRTQSQAERNQRQQLLSSRRVRHRIAGRTQTPATSSIDHLASGLQHEARQARSVTEQDADSNMDGERHAESGLALEENADSVHPECKVEDCEQAMDHHEDSSRVVERREDSGVVVKLEEAFAAARPSDEVDGSMEDDQPKGQGPCSVPNSSHREVETNSPTDDGLHHGNRVPASSQLDVRKGKRSMAAEGIAVEATSAQRGPARGDRQTNESSSSVRRSKRLRRL